MRTEDFSYIQVVARKFNNIFYPDLTKHIERYLVQNPDKIAFYQKYPLSSENLIKEIIKEANLNKIHRITTVEIMDIVKKLVERSFN